MKQPTDGCIITYTGKRFYPLAPKPEDIDPIDIAHALSNQCRYTGHVKYFYSVGEHSVLMHDYASSLPEVEELELKQILMHDSTETYLMDLAAPVKHAINGFGQAFIDAEAIIAEAVVERFDLETLESPLVKKIDMLIRGTEMYHLMPHIDEITSRYKEMLPIKIKNWTPTEAKYQMLWRMEAHGLVERDWRGEFQAKELVTA